MENLLPYKGALYYIGNFLSRNEAEALLGHLRSGVGFRQSPIRIFGREVMQPRLTAWYGDKGIRYKYSGVELEAEPWTVPLAALKKKLNEDFGRNFNSVLLNWYRNEKDSMGWHRDNEKELGAEPFIASLSLGAERRFLVREYKTHDNLITLRPAPGSLILMSGLMQQYWEHSVPKESKAVKDRINLTFRTVF